MYNVYVSFIYWPCYGDKMPRALTIPILDIIHIIPDKN